MTIYSSDWSTSLSTFTTARVVYTDFSNDKPKEKTAEQWLRERVKEICDAGNLLNKKTTE